MTLNAPAIIEPGSHTKLPLRGTVSHPFSDKIHELLTGFILFLLDSLLESGVPVLVVNDKSGRTILASVSVCLFFGPDLFEVCVMPLGHQCLIPKFGVGYKVIEE